MSGKLGNDLDDACRRFGPKVAVSAGDVRLTYVELTQRARALATLLRNSGLKANEPVHLRVSNQPLDVVALFGIWLACGVPVPIHRTTPVSVAATVQQRTRARLLVDLQSHEIGDAWLSTIASESPPQRGLLDNAAFIIFTSGSTGSPKGVVVGHDTFHGKIQQIDTLLGFGEVDRTLLVLNITFSFGLWVSLLTLLRGGTLVMRPKFQPTTLLRSLIDERITRVGAVPTMMRVLFSDPQCDGLIDTVVQRSHLRQLLIGGESLGLSLAATIRKRFATTSLVDIYGLTETSTCDFFSFPSDYAKYPGCIGRPSPNVRYRIVDADGGLVKGDSIGELQIRSPYLMNGYLDDSQLTAAAYCDGWFRTGDLGREVDGQVVELMGRQKEVISRGGNKVTPVEIEQSICSHVDVASAMAVGIPDPLLGERIHVLIVPRTGASLEIEALRRHLDSRLERFKHPDAFYRAEALPVGVNGKADRSHFKSLVLSGELIPVIC